MKKLDEGGEKYLQEESTIQTLQGKNKKKK